jgi:hypothetical protein
MVVAHAFPGTKYSDPYRTFGGLSWCWSPVRYDLLATLDDRWPTTNWDLAEVRRYPTKVNELHERRVDERDCTHFHVGIFKSESSSRNRVPAANKHRIFDSCWRNFHEGKTI